MIKFFGKVIIDEEELNYFHDMYAEQQSCVIHNLATYEIAEYNDYFLVWMGTPKHIFPIKIFEFNSPDSRIYARMCAEELCDKLNEDCSIYD